MFIIFTLIKQESALCEQKFKFIMLADCQICVNYLHQKGHDPLKEKVPIISGKIARNLKKEKMTKNPKRLMADGNKN